MEAIGAMALRPLCDTSFTARITIRVGPTLGMGSGFRVWKAFPSKSSGTARCEDRFLDWPASGQKGSKGAPYRQKKQS